MSSPRHVQLHMLLTQRLSTPASQPDRPAAAHKVVAAGLVSSAVLCVAPPRISQVSPPSLVSHTPKRTFPDDTLTHRLSPAPAHIYIHTVSVPCPPLRLHGAREEGKGSRRRRGFRRRSSSSSSSSSPFSLPPAWPSPPLVPSTRTTRR